MGTLKSWPQQKIWAKSFHGEEASLPRTGSVGVVKNQQLPEESHCKILNLRLVSDCSLCRLPFSFVSESPLCARVFHLTFRYALCAHVVICTIVVKSRSVTMH